MKTPLENRFTEILKFVKSKAPYEAELGLILGSGLGDFADTMKPDVSISTSDIPGYPPSTVVGHSGKIHFVKNNGKRVLIFQGRIHFYEGYAIEECLLPVEICFQMGVKKMIITNAAGGINADFAPGDLMLTTGFNSMFLQKELAPVLSAGTMQRRNDLLGLSSSPMSKTIRKAALEEKVDLKAGSYFYSKGPSYETPAEIRFMRSTGCDAVGMSSVHEALYGIDLGIDVAVISCITNYAAGISGNKLDHSEVTETANLVKNKFASLLRKTIELS